MDIRKSNSDKKRINVSICKCDSDKMRAPRMSQQPASSRSGSSPNTCTLPKANLRVPVASRRCAAAAAAATVSDSDKQDGGVCDMSTTHEACRHRGTSNGHTRRRLVSDARADLKPAADEVGGLQSFGVVAVELVFAEPERPVLRDRAQVKWQMMIVKQ